VRPIWPNYKQLRSLDEVVLRLASIFNLVFPVQVPPAGIADVLDPKGLRERMNKTGHMKGLTHSGRE
jgi:hypothetical protein